MYLGTLCNWNRKRNLTEEDKKFFWLRSDQYDPHPKTPMAATSFLEDAIWGYAVSADQIKLPISRGLDFRYVNGRVYTCANAYQIDDEEEIKQREPIFQKVVQELLMNWDENYSKYVEGWTANLDYLNKLSIEKASWPEISEYMLRADQIQRQHYVDHFLLMYPLYGSYLAFEEFCDRIGISEQKMNKFLQGTDHKMLETDRAMWRLAKLAIENGLNDLFLEEGLDLLSALNENEAGKSWLEEFDTFLNKYGARTAAAEFEYIYPSWREDSSPALETIRTYVQQGDYDFEGKRESLIDERDKEINAAMAGLTTEEERNTFQQLLIGCQKTYAFNEDHNFYIEQGTFVALRDLYLAIGRRLIDLGIIENADDTIFMTRHELRQLVSDLAENEAAALVLNDRHFRSLVAHRRKEWKELHETPPPPPFIGTIPPPEAMKDPIAMKIFGISPKMFQPPPAEPLAMLEGYAGSPGIVEGTARVIIEARNFGTVQPGDILVCKFTAPAWTPLFSKIKAVVTDTGGMLTHAAIAARDYGIPAVVGTWKATSTIKNGQRVKVDGNAGVVYIME